MSINHPEFDCELVTKLILEKVGALLKLQIFDPSGDLKTKKNTEESVSDIMALRIVGFMFHDALGHTKEERDKTEETAHNLYVKLGLEGQVMAASIKSQIMRMMKRVPDPPPVA